VNDTIVTVVGNVVDSPRRHSFENGAVTNFRMASNSRRYDAAREEFVDAGTFWVDVECWGALSSNVSASISKGDPVIVHGALTTHSWESESGPRSKPRIKAFQVGPNLQKGRSLFTRDKSARSADDTAGSAAAAPPADGPGFPTSEEELQAGRDYVGAVRALERSDADDLEREPAHA
jgi:single-strand DNA-binding protein